MQPLATRAARDICSARQENQASRAFSVRCGPQQMRPAPRMGRRAGGNRFNTEERGASAGLITNDSVVHRVASCVSVTLIIGYCCLIEMPDEALALSNKTASNARMRSLRTGH